MQIRDLWMVLRARWRIVLASVLVVVGIASAITLATPASYTATTRVHLSATGAEDVANLYTMPANEVDTLVQVASSPIVLEPVREQLGISGGRPVVVEVDITSGTTLLDITVTADDPQLAADLATAIPTQLAAVAREFSPMLAASGQSVESRPVVPAGVPSSPSSPDYVRNVVVAVLAGLLLGVGFALLRHNLDTRVRRVEDIREISDRPVLASVPLLRKSSGGASPFMESDPFGPHAESMRRLRTNLMFVDVTTHKHSFVVTSAMPGEGKTTTAVNLAMAMSDAGTKVLLVDGDLRNPSVADALGLEGGVGLTTILLGRAELDDVVQQWAGTNLWVLPAGQVPPNPSELLGSEAMRDLFGELLEQFDFVLVDSPPLVPVIDALLLDRLTGGTLMVVAADRTRKRHLVEALRSLETASGTVAGFALNKSALAEDSYHGYYGQAVTTGTDDAERSGDTERSGDVEAAGDAGVADHAGGAAPSADSRATRRRRSSTRISRSRR
jgi:capsular exopolysaccharide synthesis family protein